MARLGLFEFGVLSYLDSFAVFLYAVAFVGGFSTPSRGLT
jgi:hypothetical protein